MKLDDIDDQAVPAVTKRGRDEYAVGKGLDHRCGAVWFGFRIEHCQMCHQTFSGSTTGDAHRVGPHEIGKRRCLTQAELEGLGLWIEINEYGTGVWHGSPNKQGIQKRRPTTAPELRNHA